MSTKLSRYFDPVGLAVKLEQKGKRLWVEQIKLRGKWVWVDAGKPAEMLKRELERQGKIVETEKTVRGYRFDLWCDGVGYEVKSVISNQKDLRYPNVSSERRDNQLKRLFFLVKKGMKVVLAFVALSPTGVVIDVGSRFGRNLLKARDAGLRVQLWSVVNRRLVRNNEFFDNENS